MRHSPGGERNWKHPHFISFNGTCCVVNNTTEALLDPLAAQPGPKKGCCYGCGAQLQTEEPSAPGYVPTEKYEQKRQHRQLGTLVCRRCQELSNGAMVPGVADLWGRDPDERVRTLVLPDQLRTQLARVREERAVAVLLVDVLDASGSFLSRVRDLVGKNPVFLVGTKADLLPKGTDLGEVVAWLERAAAHKRLNPIATFLVSSRTREGIADVAKAVRIERRGRDVYIMGAANVGKSAFVRAFVKDMSDVTSPQFDPAALGIANYLPVESAMPGTTLQLIALNTYESGGVLYDTPGVHLQHRLQHLLDPALTKQLLPKGKLKPFVPPRPQELATQAQLGASSATRRVAASGTYFWGGLVRIDVLGAPVSTSLAFYGPKAMHVQSLPLLNDSSDHLGAASAAGADVSSQVSADKAARAAHAESLNESRDNQQGEAGGTASTSGRESATEELFGIEIVRSRGGLRMIKEVKLNVSGAGPVADVAISGLPGWVSFRTGQSGGRLALRVWAPVGIEAYVRPPLPVPPPAVR
ncbi:probable nitric oxide-associated protein 1 at N-terminal half [Coccomyxa sp. Obi]|nr:probable nitric oxide-associated protein 1 at N-terminal half [Coccomyxa sp. Obi]